MIFNLRDWIRRSRRPTLRPLFLGLICAALLSACAAPVPPERRPINELPMYGGVEKTESQKQADRKLVENTLAYGITAEEGAERMIARGWQFMDEGQPGMAMRRFNQAWLLDPGNGSSYWGMAAAVWNRDAVWDRDKAFIQAESLFLRAEVLLPDNADLQVDFGRLYGHTKKPQEAAARYRRALELDSEAKDALRNLAVAHLDMGEVEQACRYAEQAAAGGDPLEDWFFKEVRARGQRC
jgi:tetratricopeptide (TPR) repeat protein